MLGESGAMVIGGTPTQASLGRSHRRVAGTRRKLNAKAKTKAKRAGGDAALGAPIDHGFDEPREGQTDEAVSGEDWCDRLPDFSCLVADPNSMSAQRQKRARRRWALDPRSVATRFGGPGFAASPNRRPREGHPENCFRDGASAGLRWVRT